MWWEWLIFRTFHNSIFNLITFRQFFAQSEYLNMFRTTFLITVVTYHWIWLDFNHSEMCGVWGSHIGVAEGVRFVGMWHFVSWSFEGLWCLQNVRRLLTQWHCVTSDKTQILIPTCLHICCIGTSNFTCLRFVCVLMDVVLYSVISSVCLLRHWHTSVMDDAG